MCGFFIVCVYVLVLECVIFGMCGLCKVCVCSCGFCNIWIGVFVGFLFVCVCMGFVICGCGYVSVLKCVGVNNGFCNVWLCVYLGFYCVDVCVDFVKCVCVYIWVL